MSRCRNFNDPGHVHELTFSCYHQFPFLNADRTCQWLADTLQNARQQHNFALWAYVFMPEHVHLIVAPRQPGYDISHIRRAIKEPVARQALEYLAQQAPEWMDRITVQKGNRQRRYFWQTGGGYDRNIIEPKALMQMIDYIHHNPVRRGLVERAKDWKWSSAGWFVEQRVSLVGLDLIPPEWVPNE